MPLFRLSDRIEFPPAWLARSDGLLCIGGDLEPQRLILAYRNGIFPWFSNNEPILWWSPDPRLVLDPSDVKISRSLKKKIRKAHNITPLSFCFVGTAFCCFWLTHYSTTHFMVCWAFSINLLSGAFLA